MPLITDPRQIIQRLPASLIKEVIDGFPSVPSTPERTPSRKVEPEEKPTRILEAEAGNKPDSIAGASAPAEEKPRRDQLYREKRLVECWSLSTSKEFHGELPVQSQATKELILQEAILWHAREQESEKWKAFEFGG